MGKNKVSRRHMLAAILLGLISTPVVRGSGQGHTLQGGDTMSGLIVDLDGIWEQHQVNGPEGTRWEYEKDHRPERIALTVNFQGEQKTFTAKEIWEGLNGK